MNKFLLCSLLALLGFNAKAEQNALICGFESANQPTSGFTEIDPATLVRSEIAQGIATVSISYKDYKFVNTYNTTDGTLTTSWSSNLTNGEPFTNKISFGPFKEYSLPLYQDRIEICRLAE